MAKSSKSTAITGFDLHVKVLSIMEEYRKTRPDYYYELRLRDNGKNTYYNGIFFKGDSTYAAVGISNQPSPAPSINTVAIKFFHDDFDYPELNIIYGIHDHNSTQYDDLAHTLSLSISSRKKLKDRIIWTKKINISNLFDQLDVVFEFLKNNIPVIRAKKDAYDKYMQKVNNSPKMIINSPLKITISV